MTDIDPDKQMREAGRELTKRVKGWRIDGRPLGAYEMECLRVWKRYQEETEARRMSEPTIGIHLDTPFEDYLALEAVSNSDLGYAARSMKHYRYAPPITATPQMAFGSLVHTGKLEPSALSERYAVMPDLTAGIDSARPKATKAYKEAVAAWQATVGDREAITADDLERLMGMLESLAAHDRAGRFLQGDGPTEVSMVWRDPTTKIICKARVDKMNKSSDVLCDLKTTADGSQFEKAIARYGYHRQAAFYSDGFYELTGEQWPFAIVCVEKERPYAVRAAEMSPDAIEVGRAEYRQLLIKLASARETNAWPGYKDPPMWDLPAWYQTDAKIGISIDGEIVA